MHVKKWPLDTFNARSGAKNGAASDAHQRSTPALEGGVGAVPVGHGAGLPQQGGSA